MNEIQDSIMQALKERMEAAEPAPLLSGQGQEGRGDDQRLPPFQSGAAAEPGLRMERQNGNQAIRTRIAASR